MNHQQKASRWPLVLAIMMLLAGLGTLLWLQHKLSIQRDSNLTGAVRRFEETEVLGRPESPAVSFRDVESLSRSSEGDLIRELYVVKVIDKEKEVTVRPFHADLSSPAWRENRNWLRLPVGKDPSGYLYIDINNSAARAVRIAIALMGTLLAVGLGLLLFRHQRKEVQVSQLQSELEERKAQVIQLERLALAGQLSANIFHDLKKPVLNIKHEVSDALDSATSTQPEETLRVVKEQTDLFLQMLRELGMESFVNAGSEEPEWCDMEEAVERSLRLVRYEQGTITPQVEFAQDGDYLIKSCPHRLVQLLSNLFLNAYQAMNGNGKLLIRGKHLTDGSLKISLEDSGPGIPKGRREEVFSPFITTRSQVGGSGLGLYICQGIVEDLNGTIKLLAAEQLSGARFEITFPQQSVESSQRERQ